MRTVLALCLAVTASAWAVDGTVLLLERDDPRGSHHLHTVRIANSGSAWTLENLGISSVPPNSTHGFAFGGPQGPLLFRSRTGLPNGSLTRVMQLSDGKGGRVVAEHPGLTLRGFGAFAPGEAIALDEDDGSLKVISATKVEAVTPKQFFSDPQRLHDVTLARTASDQVALLAYVGPRPPSGTIPPNYQLYLVRLESNGGATHLGSRQIPRRIVGTPAVFGHQGVFYVTEDSTKRYITHESFDGSDRWKANLETLSVPLGMMLMPLAETTTLSTPALHVRRGDDLAVQLLDMPAGYLHAAGFFEFARLEAVVGASSSPATTYRVLRVEPPPTSYGRLLNVMAYEVDTGAQLRTRLEALAGPAGADGKIDALSLISAVNAQPMATDWLVQMVRSLPSERQRHFHFDNRGAGDFLRPAVGTRIDLQSFSDELAAVPRCAEILAAQ